MSRRCQITGRGPQVDHNVSHAHNITLRRFNINLQKVRVLVDGRVKRMRVSTQAIKSGLITKPPIKLKPPKQRVLRTVAQAQAVSIVREEPPMEFFSESSVVSRVFKPRAAATAEPGATTLENSSKTEIKETTEPQEPNADSKDEVQ